ncbi:MAG: DUF721 domain-containing protein [Gammaproteobacteria bacterium]|nr:DUF721 domain-containing protein [Gammaproteobacteria bacterium]
MPSKHPIRIQQLIKNGRYPQLKQLQRQIKQSDNLTDLLHEIIPFAMHQHCQAGILHDKLLVIITNSAAWATRLRYLTPQIIQHMKKRYRAPINKIQVKIRPQAKEPQKPTRQATTLSKENAELLKKTANSIQDPELAEALLKLSRLSPHS